MSDEPEEPEIYDAALVDCTCDHAPGEHSYLQCVVAGCPCDGHWEE